MRHRLLLVVVPLATLALLSAIGASFAGAPLEGVDIKLGKNPGGIVAARTTDGTGGFDFGVLPKGSYRIIVSVPPSKASIEVIVAGAIGGKLDVRFPPFNAKNSAHSNDVTVASDGIHSISGIAEIADR